MNKINLIRSRCTSFEIFSKIKIILVSIGKVHGIGESEPYSIRL